MSSTDIPHISYVDASGQLKHAYKIGGGIGNCGDGYNWQCDVIPDVPALAYYHTPSIALYNDLPRIAFYDSYAGLNFAYKDGTGWHVSVVHSGSSYGYHPSLTWMLPVDPIYPTRILMGMYATPGAVPPRVVAGHWKPLPSTAWTDVHRLQYLSEYLPVCRVL